MKKILLIFNVLFVFTHVVLAQGFIWDEDIQKQYDEMDPLQINSRAILPPSTSVEQFAPKFCWSQGETQLCVAYALAYARTTLYNQNKRVTDEDDQLRNLFSPGFMYWCASAEGNDCFSGLNPIKALEVLSNHGIAPIRSVENADYYPFTSTRLCYNYPSNFKEDLSEASLYKIDKWSKVDNIAQIKTALSQGSPCLYGIRVVNSFHTITGGSLWTPYSSESPDNSNSIHALVVIAYDDYRHGGAFKIANSWGCEWGDDGDIWIKYDDFFEYAVATFSLHRRYEGSSFGTSRSVVSIPEDINIPNFSEQQPELFEEVADYLDVELFNNE